MLKKKKNVFNGYLLSFACLRWSFMHVKSVENHFEFSPMSTSKSNCYYKCNFKYESLEEAPILVVEGQLVIW